MKTELQLSDRTRLPCSFPRSALKSLTCVKLKCISETHGIPFCSVWLCGFICCSLCAEPNAVQVDTALRTNPVFQPTPLYLARSLEFTNAHKLQPVYSGFPVKQRGAAATVQLRDTFAPIATVIYVSFTQKKETLKQSGPAAALDSSNVASGADPARDHHLSDPWIMWYFVVFSVSKW